MVTLYVAELSFKNEDRANTPATSGTNRKAKCIAIAPPMENPPKTNS